MIRRRSDLIFLLVGVGLFLGLPIVLMQVADDDPRLDSPTFQRLDLPPIGRPSTADPEWTRLLDEAIGTGEGHASGEDGYPRLAGLIEGRGRTIALVEFTSGKSELMAQGDERDGWQLRTIENRAVRLVRGRERLRLALSTNSDRDMEDE